MWLEITQEDVDRANKRSRETDRLCSICPTAQALARLYPGKEVAVGAHTARSGERNYIMSAELCRQVLGWDGYEAPFKPGWYEIEEEE